MKISVVIPCYRVVGHILTVIASIGPEVSRIYVVDDACPDGTGAMVSAGCTDARVSVLQHTHNTGVGGAMFTGYRQALADGMQIIVKIDGDGQMDPQLLPAFVAPIASGQADYTKGNRFYDLDKITQMPGIRIFGNAVLSLVTKLSAGYWDVFDPTNGYTAIHADVARLLPFDKISRRYFFETDMLFRLNTLRAVVVDIPMQPRYGTEVSYLRINRVPGEFLVKHLRNIGKRIFYNYFLREMSIASLELLLGIALLLFGAIYGSVHWLQSIDASVATPAGTVMVSAMPIILGLQLLLAFLGSDIASTPRLALWPRLQHIARVAAVVARDDVPDAP